MISREGAHVARMFLLKMNFAIARWNARMVLQARGRLSMGLNPPSRPYEEGRYFRTYI